MENGVNEKSGGIGAITGAIIIIILLIAGAWYFIGNQIQKKAGTNEIITGSSTELNDIQEDLDNVNLNILN